MCLGVGWEDVAGYECRNVAPFPPFSAGGCGLCPGAGWDVASLCLVGFAGGECGWGFCSYTAFIALVVRCVVLVAIALAPACGLAFPQLGCVAVL